MTFTYKTPNLSVDEISSSRQEAKVLNSITELLTSKVVEDLPPYFHHVNSVSDAQAWLIRIVSESRLFMVRHADTKTIIGFVFLFVERNTHAHIGYLLGEQYWRKGYATELLKGLIDFIELESKITKLIAGVATNNIVSSNLLIKIGFVKNTDNNSATNFYEYLLPQTYKLL